MLLKGTIAGGASGRTEGHLRLKGRGPQFDLPGGMESVIFRRVYCLAGVLSIVLAGAICLAQAPTGTISGSVTDESGAVMPGVKIRISNPDTGLVRQLVSGGDGGYSAASVPSGRYEIKAETPGFRALIAKATVEAGSTVTVNLNMVVGQAQDVVTVQGGAPPIDYESHSIASVITRNQIESLPLNGRSFLQLAFLEPGVTITTGTTSQYNHQFNVSIMGGDPGQTRIAVDGANIVDGVDGGTQQNFSQEVVQEFQISTTNFDLATGVTGVGAINIVTRSGGNDFHGSGYFFFRDHNMAAYPGLSRQLGVDNPFFARRQPGFYLGGPILKDKLWFFVNYEHVNQRSVVPVQPLIPEFSSFGGIFPSPYNGNQISVRFDYRLNANNNAFVRYSHDGNSSFGPRGSGSLPSNWLKNENWADQSAGSLISILRPTVVNEARFSYSYWHNRNLFPTAQDCAAPCVGLLQPGIDIIGAGLTLGNNFNAPQGRDLRHFIASDAITWQKGSHRMKFGGEWEYEYGPGFWALYDPASLELYSPETVRTFNATVPDFLQLPLLANYNTLNNLLTLPLSSFITGIGDASQPPFFQQDQANHSHRLHFFVQDTWKVSPRLTLNYGLGYNYETNLLNHDLTKPEILKPIFGAGGLGPENQDPFEFSPAMGLAWNVSKDNKTVIRAGAGIYWQTFLVYNRLTERTYLVPVGGGRIPLPSSAVPNPVSGIPGVGLGQPLYFPNNPTAFTGGDLLPVLSQIRSQLQALLGNPYNTDLSIRNVDKFKSADQLLPSNYPMPYSEHASIGVQHQFSSNMVLDADFVFKQFIHQDAGDVDFNHYNSVQGPVIPQCVGLQALDPAAHCSNGIFGVRPPVGRSHYKGLLVKLNKRFADKAMVMAAYALQSNVGLSEFVDENNWFAGWGNLSPRHVLNVSGIVGLPWGFRASFISQISSKPPFTARLGSLDINGDGTTNDLLPGTTYGEFNFSGGKSKLVSAVNQFNQTYAGHLSPLGVPIPQIVLPSNFNFGDNFSSQDLRLSRVFKFRERYEFTAFGEVFNLFNFANLSGYSNNLLETSLFGQPTQRVDQVFGSGGPRAFQVGARFEF